MYRLVLIRSQEGGYQEYDRGDDAREGCVGAVPGSVEEYGDVRSGPEEACLPVPDVRGLHALACWGFCPDL